MLEIINKKYKNPIIKKIQKILEKNSEIRKEKIDIFWA